MSVNITAEDTQHDKQCDRKMTLSNYFHLVKGFTSTDKEI